METPYDELYDVKKNSPRDEKHSHIMAFLHRVPKQIADTAQAQGVSEKFMENGLPSGVISPSMLVHDRYLSGMDAFQDAIWLTVFLVTLPFFSLNYITGGLFTLILLYWFFHVSWWEKTKIWAIKGSAKKYLTHTYRVYWIIFFLLMAPVAYMLWHFIFQLGIEKMSFSLVNDILHIIAGAEKAIHDVFGNIAFVRDNLSSNPNYMAHLDHQEYKARFIYVALIFFTITISSKIIFGRFYNNERAFNAEFSENEMRYSGEAALEKITKARNNG